MRKFRIFAIALLASMLVGAPAALAAKRLIIGGSTSVLPLMEKLATAYHRAYPKIPAPSVTGGQSDIGISGAASGKFDIGDSSRDPIQGVDPKGLTFTKIARDGICVITNPKNNLTDLSKEQVDKIFTGAIRQWSEVPGATVSGPIDLFDRSSASGTQDAFQNIFLGLETQVAPSATAEPSNGLEQSSIQSDQDAIGFVSFAYTEGTNAVGYGGVACTLANAKSGQYQGVRNFWVVTKGKPKGEAAKFIAWITKPGNTTVRKIVESEWIAIH